jgi:hypothetical protein
MEFLKMKPSRKMRRINYFDEEFENEIMTKETLELRSLRGGKADAQDSFSVFDGPKSDLQGPERRYSQL